MIDSIVFFLVAISSLAVSLIVFRQNPKNKANQYFARMSLFAIIWLSANFLENEPLSLYYRKLALELDFSSAVFMVVSFYLFCLTFPKNNTISTKKEVATYFPALFIFILSFTSTIIKNINLDNSTIIFDRGNGFFLYLIVVLFYISFGFKNLYQRYKISTGVEKTQILYVFLGIFIFAIIAAPINLILPQFIFVPLRIARIGIYSFFAFSILTTFAIIRYHLFDIKVILTELLVGAMGMALAILPFSMPNQALRLLTSAILFLFAIFGFLLIRATHEEVARKEEAERLLKAKTEFLSIASHQLRTPLTAIIGYSSMLKEGDYGKLPVKAFGAIGRVYDSSQGMIKLVNDFLSVSRLETGKTVLKPREVSLKELINQTIAELNFKAQEKKLYIKYEQPKIDKIVKIDPEKLKEVISNLIDNSIHYTEKGGITVGANANSSRINITVSDTGAGMAEEEIIKLFESFSRGSAGNELNTQGSGLGLYIAKKFVEMHNGKIWAESEGKNKGSAFHIELPNK